MFHLRQSQDTLVSPWCNDSWCAYQVLDKGDLYSIDQKKDVFPLIYLLPSHKKNLATKKIMLT